jgi:outer membrane protein TolC
MTHWKRLLVLGLFATTQANAQQPTTPAPTATLQPAPAGGAATLSLAEALSTALAQNPDYRQQLNNESPASMAVKSAYATFLPSATVQGGFNYTGSGQSNFGGTNVVKTSSSVGSSYNVNLSWALDGRVLMAPGQSKANLRATQQQIDAANVQLRAAVLSQYLTVLQTNARIAITAQAVARNQVFLDLARARYQVGQATMLDVRQAEVTRGQSDVDVLVAKQNNDDARLELYRLMGVSPPAALDQVTLTDSFPVVPPAYSLDSLLAPSRRRRTGTAIPRSTPTLRQRPGAIPATTPGDSPRNLSRSSPGSRCRSSPACSARPGSPRPRRAVMTPPSSSAPRRCWSAPR